jgi:DNA-binding response OmpR family regulator
VHVILLCEMHCQAECLPRQELGTFASVTDVESVDEIPSVSAAADALVVWNQAADEAPTVERIRRLRSSEWRVPILVIAEAWKSDGVVRVLDAGADDCLVGDCWRLELRARLRALTRRSSTSFAIQNVGQPHLDRESLYVRIQGRGVPLTATQFSILEYLVRHKGRWRPPETIMRDVLGTYHQKGTSLMRFHVHKLRNALGEARSCILWQRGKGYMFTLQPLSDPMLTPRQEDSA